MKWLPKNEKYQKMNIFFYVSLICYVCMHFTFHHAAFDL